MNGSKKLRLAAVLLVVVVALGADPVGAAFMTVDEYLFESTPGSAGISATVEMTYDSATDLLTVVLQNTSQGTGGNDAGWAISGFGFRLPDGIDIVDNSTRNSSFALKSGSSLVGSGTIGQENWGYGNGVSGGHFDTVSTLSPNTVLSTLKADVATATFDHTWSGSINTGVGSVDHMIVSTNAPGGPSGQSPFVKDALVFSLFLTDNGLSGLLASIEEGPIVVAFGSPNLSTIPEPTTVAMWSLFGIVGFVCWRRKSKRT